MLARLTLLFALALTGCIRDDPNHCANQTDEDGNTYCMQKHELPYCSACNAKVDGCVMASTQSDIPSECRPSNVTTVADDDTSADPTSVSTSSDSIADDTASTSTSTPSDSTSLDDEGASSESGPAPPVCNNDILEQHEVCDGTDLNGQTCQSTGHGDGELACDPATCEYDFDGCDSDIPVCGDGVVNQTSEFEVCDGEDFDDQTCGGQPGHGNAGELACTDDCQIDASGCCLDNGEPCELNTQCCSGLCGLLEQGPDCVLG